jgi:3-isopropylmalate/(R)-2-methylmalate dehydratase small subunit
MLPVILPEETVDQLFNECHAQEGYQLTVDLPNQLVKTSSGQQFAFSVDEFRKHCLINGLDDIGLTLQDANIISEFEDRAKQSRPWVFGALRP